MDLKKTAIALLGLGLTGVAAAGGFIPAPACTNHPVTVPCERSAWDLGVTGLWARPTFDHSILPDANAVPVSTKYKFGFGVEASYHWSTGNDLTAGWTRHHKTYLATGLAGTVTTANAIRSEYDSFTVEFGQHIDVGPNWDARLHFGGEYTKLVANTATATGDSSNNDTTLAATARKFTGFGPRTGADVKYNISNGFGLVGRGSVGLLVGDTEQTVNTDPTTKNRIVTASIRSSVGVSYTMGLGQGSATVEGGYRVDHLVSPFMTAADGHYGLNGAYVTLKYVS